MRKLFALVLAGTTLMACEQAPDEEARSTSDGDELTAADSAWALRTGEPIATGVAQGLAGRLQAQLAAAGPAGAVDFCATTALELTDSLAAAAGAGIEVKRATTRLRNPRNAPDSLERVALAWFDSARAASGTIPPYYIQAGRRDEVRYYRPLVIAPFCMQCHGDPATMDSAVVRVLGERYPGDEATGYREGELRGVLRVSLPRGGG